MTKNLGCQEIYRNLLFFSESYRSTLIDLPAPVVILPSMDLRAVARNLGAILLCSISLAGGVAVVLAAAAALIMHARRLRAKEARPEGGDGDLPEERHDSISVQTRKQITALLFVLEQAIRGMDLSTGRPGHSHRSQPNPLHTLLQQVANRRALGYPSRRSNMH